MRYKRQGQVAKTQTEILKQRQKGHIANKIAWERSVDTENRVPENFTRTTFKNLRGPETVKTQADLGSEWERRERSKQRKTIWAGLWLHGVSLARPNLISVNLWTDGLMHTFMAFLIIQVHFFWKGEHFYSDTWHLLNNCVVGRTQREFKTIWVKQQTWWSFFSNFWRQSLAFNNIHFLEICC